MYGVPLPPQQAAPAGQTSQGVSTQGGHPPQWGGQGYHNQYMQQRQQLQQQMASMQRPNAPMPGAGMPPQPPSPSGPAPQQAQRPPGMYSGGMIRNALAMGGQINLDLPRHEKDVAMRHVIHGALRYGDGGPTGMQTVEQAPPPTGNQPPQGALAPHAAMAASPLGQNGTPSGLYTPQNFQPALAAAPSPSQMSDYQRSKGIFTADSTPQYLSNPAPGQERSIINQLGPQGQAAGAPPSGTAGPSVSEQIAAILNQGQGHAEGGVIHREDGGDIDFTDGGQPIDYNAGRKRDTIPAMLDHGEYVFTRKAVQGIGDGDIHTGGKILGALMRHFESKA